ncbi:MAG: presenilin family intramembrane aspartyl protease [Candidatus Woesearchaeota archaeon]
MKHQMPVVAKLLLLFFLAQCIGILVLLQYIDFTTTAQTGETTFVPDAYVVQPLQIENETLSFIPIIIAVLIATALIFVIIKYNILRLWKIWFLLSVSVTLSFAFYPFIQRVLPNQTVTIVLTILIALFLGIWKIFRPNQHVHNFTELFIYGGLAAILVPILNIYSAIVLLTLIAVYDFYMVFISKHMVTLAESSMKSEMLAGVWVKSQLGNRKVSKEVKPPMRKRGRPKKMIDPSPHKPYQVASHAIIGGGDIAFSLLFAGAVMKFTGSIFSGIIIAISTTIALSLLFIFV